MIVYFPIWKVFCLQPVESEREIRERKRSARQQSSDYAQKPDYEIGGLFKMQFDLCGMHIVEIMCSHE